MNIGSKSWRELIIYKTTNVAYGFRGAGIWPLYFTSMQSKLELFKDGDIANSGYNTTWVRCW